VAKEVLKKTAIYLKKEKKLRKLYLGVHKSNFSAIRAYRKVGFKSVKHWDNGGKPKSWQKVMLFKLA